VSGVPGEFLDHVHVDPAQGQGSAAVVHREVVERVRRGDLLGIRPGLAVLGQHGLDGVVVGQDETVAHRRR